MRKIFSLAAGLAAVALAAVVTIPANAVTGGTIANDAGANVFVHVGAHCSGTLLNRNVVLTAWHCIKEGAAGEIRWGNKNRKKGKKISTTTVWHEHDIAMVWLAEDVPFGDVAYPVLGTEDPKVGDTVEFFGFGYFDNSGTLSDVLRTGSASVVPPWNKGWGDMYWGPSWTIQQNGNGNTEGGDSGGGAYHNGKLVGVTSRGNAEVTHFASVAAHLPFINEIIGRAP